MSSANVRKFDIDEMAERALWFDQSQLDLLFRQEVVPSRGVNKLERADIRNRVRKRIAELRKAAQRPAPKPRRPASHNYPDVELPPPFTQAELRAAVREIEFQIDRKRTQARLGDLLPYGCDFSEAARWLLDQVTRPCCLKAIACPLGADVCHRCGWIFLLHSRAGRQASEGTMLQVQRDLKLLNL